MNFPNDVKNRIEKEAEKYKISSLVLASKFITENYKKNSGKNEALVCDKIGVITYAIVRMPATFGAVSSALEKTLESIDDKIDSVLDVGSGTGASFLACEQLLGKLETYTCVEREKEMINFTKNFVSDAPKFLNLDATKEFPDVKADLVLVSYMLNELDDDNCFLLLKKMIESTNKYILIVDPGTPESFIRMRKIRRFLIENNLSIVAPCTHMENCPMEENDWCHFSTRVPRSKLHKLIKEADVPFEDEKFCYIAASKEPIAQTGSRILRHPLINPGMVKLVVCTNKGSKEELTVTRKNKQAFKAVKKSNAGDKYYE